MTTHSSILAWTIPWIVLLPLLSHFSRVRLCVTPWTVAHTRLLCPWNSPGQNTGAGSLSLFQGIFPTQGSNPGLLHTHLNAEFQRIARRNKKAFLSDQCKEQRKRIEWERLEISSRKLRDTKGIFYAKMGTIKDRFVCVCVHLCVRMGEPDLVGRWWYAC